MARVRLFVNSRRMQRRVTEVMTAEGASFLPQITVVSDLGDDPWSPTCPAPCLTCAAGWNSPR